MGGKRRRFQRKLGHRRYRKLFIIATEGTKTEPQYFSLFNSLDPVVRVHCLKGGLSSSPAHILQRMEQFLIQEELASSDEAWLVIDRDRWTPQQLNQLHIWTSKSKKHNLALSNPKFEFWLLLHFEEGTGIRSAQDCNDRLERHLPGYDKGIATHAFTIDRIEIAVRRARQRDHPPCVDWPRAMGSTTVYRLVESILRKSS